MSVKHPIVPIQAVNISAAVEGHGCDACHRGTLGPSCQFTLGARSGPPRLSGPADELARVTATLSRVLGSGQLDGMHWVQSIDLSPGEVAVVLTADSRCAGAGLADSAFQALKRLLVDTDIYVRLAAA